VIGETDNQDGSLAPCEQPPSHGAEDYFRRLVENTLDVVTIISGNGTIRYESPAIERVLGYRLDELIGRNVLDLVHPEDRDGAAKALHRALEEPGVPHTAEVRIRHRNGSWRILEAVGKRLTGRGAPEVVMSSRDITQRRQGEKETWQRQAELAHLLRLSTMGEMASEVAHELNQPLAAIANYARGCMRRISSGAVDNDQLLSALDRIAGQAMRAGAIIRGLRSFVSKGDFQPESADLNELIREADSFVEPEAHQHHVSMRLDLAAGPLTVRVDTVQIEQVVLNLVRNGIEAVNGAAEGELVVSSGVVREGVVEVSVSDTGGGISSALGDRMFEPFFSTKAGGLGMGLPISRSIIEVHGGRLWATANPDRGATFHFTLPLEMQSGKTPAA